MIDLVPDVVEEILLRLPLKSILKFKTVSKQWRSILESRCFGEKRRMIMKKLQKKPQILAAAKKYQTVRQLILGKEEEEVELEMNYIRSHAAATRPWLTCDGLVCIPVPGWVNIMNPSTREVLRFPFGPADVVKNERYDHMDDYWDYFPGDWAMGFGKDKVNGSYKVVRMFFDTNQFDILDVDIGEWRKLRSPSLYRQADPRRKSECVNGSIYWLRFMPGSVTLLALDLHTEEFRDGVKAKTPSEFVLGYPDEYIKSVETTYHKTDIFRNTVITSLKFETSKGRTSFFGYNVGKKFVLEQKGRRLVGFHGRAGSAIDALGAYFAPVHTPKPTPTPTPTPKPTPTPAPLIPAKKLPAVGGNGGVSWDDGVNKIFVGQGTDGVAFVKFEYSKGKDLVSGNGHGKMTLLGTEEFVLEDSEYLTTLEGYYDKIFGVEAPIIVSLKFKTNKRESTLFGMDSGEKFSLGEKGHKIVGIYGKASDVVHSVGVAVVPITTTK